MPWIRILSGIVAIAVALSMILLGGWYFTAGLMIIVLLGQLEYFQMVKAKGIAPAAKITLAVSQLLLIVATLASPYTNAAFAVAGTFICFYLLFQPSMASIADISTSILGLFYGGWLPSYWVRLRVGLTASTSGSNIAIASTQMPIDGLLPASGFDASAVSPALAITLLAFSCIWAADIGAYTIGKFFGRTRLSDISPKKTVEGAVFGILGSAAMAVWGAWYLDWNCWPISGLLLGILIGITSLLGDLTESMMKRDAGVKDSGQIIPGHGGILDRTDSYVFTAPLVYYFVTIFLPLLPHTWGGF